MRPALLVAVLFTMMSALLAAELPRRVVGYLADWSLRADTLPAEQLARLTHLNYAFALPQADGGLTPPGKLRRFDPLVTRAHAAGVKVLLAVGGWGQDKPLVALAADATRRTRFVGEIMAFVDEHHLDGVDLDWEYPKAGAQAEHFAALMHELAQGLRPQGRLLTAAVHAVMSDGILAKVFADVDFLNLMVYDGDGDDAGHASMRYARAALDHWQQRGLPPDKLVLGVPFYAQPKDVPWSAIVAAGAEAMQADRWDIAGSTVTYNGIPTMRRKAELARQQAGGVMIWELGQDAPGAASLLTVLQTAYAAVP